MRTMIIDKLFDITHYLGISLMSGFCHVGDGGRGLAIQIPGRGWLRVEDEGHGEEALKTDRLNFGLRGWGEWYGLPTLIHSI